MILTNPPAEALLRRPVRQRDDREQEETERQRNPPVGDEPVHHSLRDRVERIVRGGPRRTQCGLPKPARLAWVRRSSCVGPAQETL